MIPSFNIAWAGAPAEWTAALLKWPTQLAQTLILGSAALCLGLAGTAEGKRASRSLAQALSGWWRWLGLAAAIFSCLALVDQAAGMAGVTWRSALPLIGEVLAKTSGGHIWEWRLPVALALAIAPWMPLPVMARAIVLMVLCASSFLAESLMSHAIDFGAIAIACGFVHMLAAATWGGALFGYWAGARVTDDFVLRTRSASALSTLAAWSVSIVALSGLYLAYEGLGHTISHLLYSSYGRVLSLKLEVFVLVLLIGAHSRFFLMPAIAQPGAQKRFRRNSGIETIAIAGIVGLAAILATTPPARMAMAAAQALRLIAAVR